MHFFHYLVTAINEDNKGTIVKHIADHIRKNNVREVLVDIRYGGQVRLYTDRMELSTEWRGVWLERQYYTIEAALHDGIEFAKGCCPKHDKGE